LNATTWNAAAGSSAALVQELSLTLYVGAALIFLFVMALVLYAVFSRPRRVRAHRWLAGGGLVFPGLVLGALLAYSIAVSGALAGFNGQAALRFLLDCVSDASRALGATAYTGDTLHVEVNARQWWWEITYRTGADAFATANELHLPASRAIELDLVSEDVIHSFWVPALAGKVDMIPGHRNRLVLRADTTGVFRGQCAEYCGAQHALMALNVVVVPEAEFERWRVSQLQPAPEPANDVLAIGRAAFIRGGCGACHTVRGTEARGAAGPDLTHVGGRLTLAAGTLDNHIGTLAGWIAGPQALKPGNRMPDARSFSGAELRAVAAWLESLE
jgi:cytochrome c oxidase subunit 2